MYVESVSPLTGRGMAVQATVASKAPTSCWHTCAPYHWSRRGAPPPPVGSRDAAAERCPGRGRAVGAACRLQRHVSTQRTSSPRPPARHRRHRRFDAFARTRPVDQHRARTPLSDRSGGRSTYPCDVLHERRSADARARGDRSTVVSQSATSGGAATNEGRHGDLVWIEVSRLTEPSFRRSRPALSAASWRDPG